MKRLTEIDGHFRGALRRAQRSLVVAAATALASLTGCHHRRAQPVLLPPQTPVALVQVPEPAAPPLMETQTPKLPPVPMEQPAAKPKKAKKRAPKTAPATAPPPVVATTSPSPVKKPSEAAAAPAVAKTDSAVAGIGALTVGGEQSPRALQEASELLASNERRLGAISGDAVKTQAELLGKVRNFQKDAQLALSSGDAEGAKTLAMKGKLLLDDFDKAEAP